MTSASASASATTTRKQLRGYGASRYLSRKLTASLSPVTKSGNAYVYVIGEVIVAIRAYGAKARIQLTTKEVLEKILTQLLAQLDNVVPLVPNSGKAEVSNVAQQLLSRMRHTDKALAEMKATVASIGKPTS